MGTMIDYNPRQISLGLVTKLVDLRYDVRPIIRALMLLTFFLQPNVKYFPFPIELLSDPDCKVSFPTVMNIQGQVSQKISCTTRLLTELLAAYKLAPVFTTCIKLFTRRIHQRDARH